MDLLLQAIEYSINSLLVTLVHVALLAWILCIGWAIGRGAYEYPDCKKTVFFSMPIAALIAAFFGFWSYCLENPGETENEALYDALVVFFNILLPLWAGCIWAIINLSHPDWIRPPGMN